jgi:hypothetical protein
VLPDNETQLLLEHWPPPIAFCTGRNYGVSMAMAGADYLNALNRTERNAMMMSDEKKNLQRMYLDTICELGAWGLIEMDAPENMSSVLHFLKQSLDRLPYC